MKNYYKNEKGSMAIYAIVTVLTFLLVSSAILYSAVGVRKRQLQTMPKIKEVYEKYLNSKYEIYEAEVEKRRDKVAPTATISVSPQTIVVGETITVTIIQTDNKDRLDYSKCAYMYNSDSSPIGIDVSAYASGLSAEENNIEITFTSEGTYYIHVLTSDLDKNSIETISLPITVTNE